eukprot:1196345-Prorocentrum_minimum.AAC.3
MGNAVATFFLIGGTSVAQKECARAGSFATRNARLRTTRACLARVGGKTARNILYGKYMGGSEGGSTKPLRVGEYGCKALRMISDE